MHTDIVKRADAYLKEHLSKKSKRTDGIPVNSFSRTSSTSSMATDEGLLEQRELPAASKTALDKILWQRSLQLRERQDYWEVRHCHLPIYVRSLILTSYPTIYFRCVEFYILFH